MTIEKLTLEPDEVILLQVRKHWFVLATQIFALIIGAITPPILFMFIYPSLIKIVNIFPYISVLLFLYTVWLLLVWMGLFNIWTNYYLDVWTITNKRLMAADQRGLFFRTTASFRLERLQDIIVSIDGILATLLDYGTLEIQTAGEERNFKERGLPSPGNIKALIMHANDTLVSHAPTSIVPN